MAAIAYLIYQDGKFEVPEELRQKLQLHNGSRVEVTTEPEPRLIVPTARASRTGVADWSIYEGILSGLGLDLNADLEAERLREIELDTHL